jgi:acetyl-CoA carboxylase, biotin carboxylase subunit
VVESFVIKRLLIANRGEIALRIIRACRELGIESVAVYSEADTSAPHVAAADRAIAIGPAPAADSYLSIPRLVDAARESRADAVHPGYGFLSENAEFARACEAAGLVFVGPPADVIAAMGSKIAARTLMQAAGVPVVPGETPDDQTDAGLRRTIERVGLPVLVKASAGGGGKGMRLVRDAAEIAGATQAARREAAAAFGDGTLYVERLVDQPRHIEVQVIGDHHGRIDHVFERECSVQRRHQKMIEEAPSVAVTPALRKKMGETAVRATRAAGYVNAGTCEFLLDQNGDFYFLEMNTRLQVEHPVTELVTGIDLVQWQLRIAAGERLPFKQQEISPRGWAMECRITSEDAGGNFLPSTGTIDHLHLPSGPGVRWDGGIESGSEIGLYYDPMLAKLIVWGSDREQAITRMRRALVDLVILGVETSRDFHIRVMDDDEFRRGDIDIQWLERRLAEILARQPRQESVRAAAIAAALLAERDREARSVSGAADVGAKPARVDRAGESWKQAARLEALRD